MFPVQPSPNTQKQQANFLSDSEFEECDDQDNERDIVTDAEDEQLEESDLIWGEAIDDADSWERSNDEGWYYDDE